MFCLFNEIWSFVLIVWFNVLVIDKFKLKLLLDVLVLFFCYSGLNNWLIFLFVKDIFNLLVIENCNLFLLFNCVFIIIMFFFGLYCLVLLIRLVMIDLSVNRLLIIVGIFFWSVNLICFKLYFFKMCIMIWFKL